jgi:PAS domain S-box-containing protein
MVSTIASALGYALILLTAATSAYAIWRRGETHRLDILALVGLLLAKRLYETIGAVGIGLLLAEPYVLLRLVGHFREVPAIIRRTSLAAIGIATVAFTLWPEPHSGVKGAVTAAFSMTLMVYAALALTAEVRRTSGVTARRLALAAIGTYLLAAAFLTGTLPPLLDAFVRVGHRAGTFFTTGMLASYYIAFATPRWLRSSWQRAEQARYLSLASELNPEERGTRTADDLSRAAAGASSNCAALVALQSSVSSPELVVRASTHPPLIGVRVHAGTRLLGRALRANQGVMGPTTDCEPPLADSLVRLGVQLLVAPIVAGTRTWGVVLVVQRRGSLFPEDDLQLLVQLGRYAGTALDHAQLVIEARERERKAADRRIREAESRMALLLDNIRDYALFVLDHRGHVVTWHPGAEHVFGYTAAEMIDEPAAGLYNRTEEEFLRLLDEARQLGRAEFEGPCRRRDGAKFTGTTIVRPLSGDDYELEGFVGVTRDVTTQRELEQQLRQSQKMEAIGRLAGGIAHDFNNLLTAILGYADWLMQDFEPGSLHHEQVQEIQNAAERAAGLTRQLLTFSRKQVLQHSPINMSRLAAELIPMLQRLIGEHITIVDRTASEIVAVTGDRSQLEQVIVNLAVNARDAMPAGGTLTIGTTRLWLDQAAAGSDLLPGPYALLEVIDTGVGMDAATQARIFEPFFTTKDFGRGTGLGLSTVYGIVKQMGGSVRVVSEPQQGTTFRLYFPETRMRESHVSAPVAAIETPRGTETLLLVEDDEAVRAFLTRVLERQGYRVIAGEHQAAALALVQARAEPIDLVIADIVMPGGTGPELVRALHELQPGVPALYISGYADAVLASQTTSPKASHFLQKPFTAPELLTRIRQILSRG